MGRSRGFTALELLITVSLISILFTLALPSLAAFKGRLYLKCLATEITNELRRTQIKAMISGGPVVWGVNQRLLPPEIFIVNNKIFKYASSGNCLPGGSGTLNVSNRYCQTKKIVVSSVGRVRVE